MPLTEANIRNAKPKPGKDNWLNDGNGLYLRVHKGGSKTWVIRRKRFGKTTVTTVGQYPEIGLKQARLAAAQAALSGQVSRMTVAELVKKYIDEILDGARPVPVTLTAT
jgi:hypothetical protein